MPRIAAVQTDCTFADVPANLSRVRSLLRHAADGGANLAVFPECIFTGYSFRSGEEAAPHAVAVNGREIDTLSDDCRTLNVYAVVGLLERTDVGFYNACALVGPDGLVACYRKIHLPYMGVDRFALPGDRPFAVHEVAGMRIGMNICYDGSFPESARVLTLLGADVIVLPTNWPTGARRTIALGEARALENHVYYCAVNRVGEERGFRFIGKSRIVDPLGVVLAEAGEDGEAILYADIDVEFARKKREVKIPGEHEVDRVGHRRPEMYGPLTA